MIPIAMLWLLLGAEATTVEDLMVVDCLLPGRMRYLPGVGQYQEPRRLVRTTAIDCRIRFGEYTDEPTALAKWLERAKKGEADAQFYVARLYERERNDAEALAWYRKAAAKDHRAAQISFAAMLERGAGTPADPAEALKWFRRAAGVADDKVVIDSSEYAALQQAQLDLSAREEEIEELRRRLEELQANQEQSAEMRRGLEEKVATLRAQIETQRGQIARLQASIRARPAAPPSVSASPVPLGRFYALVIGNGDYRNLPDVATAEHDARAMAALLRKQYGFEVELLINGTRFDILKALNALRESITEEDNLFIFYAGRARRDRRADRVAWQPVDAEPASTVNSLSNQLLGDHLNLIPARHILVVADACFEGTPMRSSPPMVAQGMSPQKAAEVIRSMKARKARLALTSGTEAPTAMPDSASSRFTAALLRVLESEKGVFQASRVYRDLVAEMAATGTVPTFWPIPTASHEGADFFFERKGGS